MAQSAKDAGLAVDGTVGSMLALQQKGGLISSKVLPKFAENLRAAARNNGALDKALQSNRVAMNQMMTSVQGAADTVFKSGWSEGLTDLFTAIGELFSENETFFKSFGKIAGTAFKVLAFVVREVLNPVLSALGSILNLVGDWGAIVLGYFAKFTPIIGSVINRLGGFKGVFTMMFRFATRMLLPFTLILGVLEEIAEFFAPTGKKTLIGFNINDIEMPEMPTWFTDAIANKGNSVSNGAGLPSYLTTPKVNYGGYGTQPITVQTDLHMNDEVIATAVSKTNALNSTIDSKIAESNSYNH